MSALSYSQWISYVCRNFCEMLNLRRYHEETDIRSQRWRQRWDSHVPCCLNLVCRNNYNWICIHSCNLYVCCESWSDEILPIQSDSWITNGYWCYWRVIVSWKLLILALRTGWICTTVDWTVEGNSYLLWSDIFCKSLTNYLTILCDINLLTNW